MSFFNIHSITSVKYADVEATGVFPAAFTDVLYGVKEGTATLTLPQQDETDIFVEESSFPFGTIKGNFAGAGVNLQLLGIDMTDLAAISGWTRTAADITDPEQVVIGSADAQVFKALEITGKNDQDDDIVMVIAKAALNVGMSETITKSDMVGVSMMGKIMQPINTSTGAVVTDVIKFKLGVATA